MEKKGTQSARSHRLLPTSMATADIKASSANIKRKKVFSGGVRTMSKLKGEKQATSARSRPDSAGPEGDNDIKFINIESRPTSARKAAHKSRTMDAQEILERCEETDYREVYEICLRGSQLTEVPNLEKFCKARLVDLSSNCIQMISRLECCADLRELKLYDNQLETIDKLDALNDLTHLQLQHNHIRALGRGLVNCRKLCTLRLDWNQLTRLESKEIAALSKLTTLDLSNNKLDNVNALNSLPNLMELAVCNNRLKTLDLPRCKKIEELDLSGNRITELSSFLPHSATLKILHVSKNAISKMELSAPLGQLEELHLAHNTIRRLCNVASRLPSLQLLDLSHNHIHNDKELLCLQGCKSLRELDLTNNPFDLDELGQVGTNPAEIVSTLQVLDGMVIKKQSSESKAPLMRPMSASYVISSRQVQSQMDVLDTNMRTLQESLERKFQECRMALDQLPSQPAPAVSHRPVTRGSRRSRIMEAKAFALNSYSES